MPSDDMADGAPAKMRLDRGAKKKALAKGDKKGAVNVTVVMAPKPDKAAATDMPMPPMPPPGAMPPMPPGPPPGGPPMPMRASGGRVKKADGGDVSDPVPAYLRDRMADKKLSARGNEVAAGIGAGTALVTKSPIAAAIAGASGLTGWAERKSAKNLKRGAKAFEATGLPGRPSRDDDEERASGGRVGGKNLVAKSGFQAGAGGGLGRLEKTKDAKKK